MDRPQHSEATMNRLTASLAALALAACNAQKADPAQAYRDALPKATAAAIGTYQDAGATPGALSVARQPLGDSNIAQSEYAVMSYYLAVAVNGGAGLVLDLLQFITGFPPSACDAHTSCTWGPWSGDQGLNGYKLVVTRNGAAYDYELSGQNALVPGSPWVPFLTGKAVPADRSHGSGTFTLDFDAHWAGLAHAPGAQQQDYGRLVLDYDNTTVPTVTAQFIGAYDRDPQNAHFVNAAYSFVAAASGGELQVAFENLDTTDTVALRTRWSATGQGRADAVYTPAGQTSLTASECWAGRSASWIEVYDTKHLDIPQLSDPTGCAPFTTFQAPDIQLPH